MTGRVLIDSEPEVQIDSDLPEQIEDWDETALRKQRAAEVEDVIAQNQPGRAPGDVEGEGLGPDSEKAGERTRRALRHPLLDRNRWC